MHFTKFKNVTTQSIAFLGALVTLVIFTYEYLLIFFGAYIFANFISRFSEKASKHIKLSQNTIAITIWVCIFLATAISLLLFGVTVYGQFQKYIAEISNNFETIQTSITSSQYFSKDILQNINFSRFSGSIVSPIKNILQYFSYMGLLIVISLFLTFELKPIFSSYNKLAQKYFDSPKQTIKKAQDIAEKMYTWLYSRLISMLFIAILTYILLLFVGLEYSLPLAITAGILSFVPNIGPIASVVPAVLIASPNGFSSIGIVIGIYILVQIIESNIVTPMVIRSHFTIPITFAFFFQVIFGSIFGTIGLVFAVPLGLCILIFLELYE